ncbi:hypothetical protein F4777DRAFT_578501 [Nemania sp. FL0916]|nr:hypothetical protein F4777DRAFT_578501 [Nemania sp. FL0916]
MHRSSLRFTRQVGRRLGYQARPQLFHNSKFGDQQIVGALYSSLGRQSSEGKNVIVTGSSRGLGKAIALRLAADGYNVCVTDLSSNQAGCDEVANKIRCMGRKACTVAADVTKRDEVKNMIRSSVQELGPLNTMIANAGIVQVSQLLEISEQDFERMFRVNVFGAQNCLAEAAKQLIKQGNCKPDSPGKLLAASSIVGFKAYPLLPHYSATKWAIRALMQAYAQDLAKHNITANAYAPGIVKSKMWDVIDDGAHELTGLKKGTVMETLAHSMTALDRVSVPEDTAKLVSFLASRDSDFITGQTYLVDGGIIFT